MNKMMNRLYADTQTFIENIILRPDIAYRSYLRWKYGANKPVGYPKTRTSNCVLKSRDDWINAVEEVESLNLPLCRDRPKNWDCLIALDCILKRCDPTAHILDAGAELYSMILPWLYLYGYRNLLGVNLTFKSNMRRGPIHYQFADITQTRFKENTFDAITCLSVIEHGVNMRAYFKEMSRILKPNGILITSTDYFEDPIDTRNQKAYGVEVHILCKEDVMSALNFASEFGLEPTGQIDLQSIEKAVCWERFNLGFTFINFILQKKSIKVRSNSNTV